MEKQHEVEKQKAEQDIPTQLKLLKNELAAIQKRMDEIMQEIQRLENQINRPVA
jgi:chaperonin cofactor prefoldin